MKTNIQESFLELVRLGIGTEQVSASCLALNGSELIYWPAIKSLADEQGLTAVVLDGINCLNESNEPFLHGPTRIEKLQWIGEVEYTYERYYEKYRDAICSLACFYNQQGFKMMVLKGYICSLDWPKPNHRPCGDIDIWLFGKQKEADVCVRSKKGIIVDDTHHHHTVFNWRGFSVENFFDFFNIHAHKSNKEIDAILKRLAQDDSNYVELNGKKIYMPSPNLHALFLIRHALGHFTSTHITVRQLLDWAFFVKNHGDEIDWNWLIALFDKYQMRFFFDCINAICVEDLGFPMEIFPSAEHNPMLKNKVLKDILEPKYKAEEPTALIPRLIYKYQRWRGNAWKREMCFLDSGCSSFISVLWSHILKPSTL